MESSSEEYGSVSEIEELSKRIEQLGRKSTEEFGSVSEIEELSKRIDRLGGNSIENYTAVDSRCVSGQSCNLEKCAYSSADRSKQKHGNDNISIFILTGSKRITEMHEGMNKLHIRKGKADDKISCPISRLKDAFKRLGHQIHCITSEYESNPKNPNKAEFLRKIVKLKNNVFNLMGTATYLTRTVDSRSVDSQPRIFMNATITHANELEQHHKCKILRIPDRHEWKPYHKLAVHERQVQRHYRRAEACSQLRNIFPSKHPFISLMQKNLVDLTHPSISNSRTDVLAYPCKSVTLDNQVDLTHPSISNSRTDVLAYPCKSLTLDNQVDLTHPSISNSRTDVLAYPYKSLTLDNQVDLTHPSISNSCTHLLAYPYKSPILEKQVDGTLPSIPNSIRMKHKSNDINYKVDKE